DMEESAETDESALKLFSVYQELFFYSPGLQQETAVFVRRSIARVFGEFGIEETESLPDMVSLSERLLQYGKENDLSPAFITASLFSRIDEEAGMLPMMLNAELESWKEAMTCYLAAKTVYNGIQVPEKTRDIMDHYENIIVSVLESIEAGENYEVQAKEAGFYRYLLNFLIAYEDCINTIEFEDEKEHWRTYISEPWFNLNAVKNHTDLTAASLGNPESSALINGAHSREEGILAETCEFAKEAFRRLTESFKIFIDGDLSERQKEFSLTAEIYLNNPDKPWEDIPDDYEFFISQEIFWQETDKLQNNSVYEESLKQQIVKMGYEYSRLPSEGEDALYSMNTISMELERTVIYHQNALMLYNQKAGAFADAGNHYEALYNEAKLLFSNVDKARRDYEKQDAIQRWAGTSYLSSSSALSDDLQYYREPAEELAHVRERHDRAQIALEALQSLYNDEAHRPYENKEYNQLYEEYLQSFKKMLLSLKAKNEYETELEKEKYRNLELYSAVSGMISSFTNPKLPEYYDNYSAPALANSSWMDFVVITETGSLGISYDRNTFKLRQTSQAEALKLSDYFKTGQYASVGENNMSDFEKVFSNWAARMSGYKLNNTSTFQTWGLALDYIIRNLSANNPGIRIINESYVLTNMGADGGIRLVDKSLNDWLNQYRNSGLQDIQKNAWNKLSFQEQRDLEFLAVLYLTGCEENGLGGFANVSQFKEMEWLLKKGQELRREYTKKTFVTILVFTPIAALFTNEDFSPALNAAENRKKSYRNTIDRGSKDFTSELSKTVSKISEYRESCAKLAAFCVKIESGIGWQEIEAALYNLDNQEKKNLKSFWEEMLDYRKGLGENAVYTTIGTALEALYAWGKGVRDSIEVKLENVYLENEKVRRVYQEEYRKTLDSFIEGKSSLYELQNAANFAYGPEAPALKNHIKNLGAAIIFDLKAINADRAAVTKQYRDLAVNYTNLIERAYTARFTAELDARESGWNEQIKDLNIKLASWREASGLIFERGRKDWKDGFESMRAAYERWEQEFIERYTDIDTAWNMAYLESLNNKESWINQAMTAVAEAFDNNLLALAGADAESQSRKLDTFMPSSFYGLNGAEKAAGMLQGILDTAGIKNAFNAFTFSMESADTISTVVKTGVSGLGVWDSGQAKAAAREFARNSTEEMADGKMTILAFQAREAAYGAKKALEESIAQSNKKTDTGIDDLYTKVGGWNRVQRNYVKDIIVHSTVFVSVITDTVILETYRWFVMDYWDFKIDLTDDSLKDLNYLGVQAVIAAAQEEIRKKSESVFGNGTLEGDFNQWLGKAPTDNNDNGTGELGRLIGL
ncbi:MAG: hypothetical protein LBH07_04930, partial [Treponema sp.]|nr:hypothetical protein [Treponema sp.]